MDHSDTLIADLKSTGDLADLSAFVAVVAAGGFTAAANRSGTDKSQLSRRVRALEERLAVRLLNRTTRSIRPTEAGQRLYAASVGPLADLLHSLAEANTEDVVRGVVRIGGPAWVTGQLWVPLIDRARTAYPELSIDLRLSDQIADFVAEGFDMALRLGNLPDSSLIARRVASWRYVIVATPRWAAQNPIAEPEDLAEHWIEYASYARSPHWRFARGEEKRTIRTAGKILVNSGEAMRDLVTAGVSTTALPDFIVWDALASGQLVRLLPDWRVDHEHGMYLVTANRRYTPQRVVAVRTLLEEVLQASEENWATAHL